MAQVFVAMGVLGAAGVGAAIGGGIGLFTAEGADDMGIERGYRMAQGGLIGGVAGIITGVFIFV